MKGLKHLIFFGFFFCYGVTYFAANRLDSLIKLYNTEKVDTSKIRLTLKISKLMQIEHPEDSTDLAYLHKSYLNSKLSDYPYLKLKVSKALGDAYMRFNMFDEALRYFKEFMSLASQQNDVELKGQAFMAIGAVYDAQRKHEEALQITMQGFKIIEKSGDKELIAQFSSGLASQYYQMGQSEEAIKYFYKTLGIYESLKDTLRVINSLKNLSLAYDGLRDFDRTKQLLLRAIGLARGKNGRPLSSLYGALGAMFQNMQQYDSALVYNTKQIRLLDKNGSPDDLAIAYGNLGIIYNAMKNYDLAKMHYQNALEIFKKLNSYRLVTISYVNLGELSLKTKEPAKAHKYFDEAIKQTANSGELDILVACHQGKYEAYVAQNNYKMALDEYGKVKDLRDSIKQESNLTKILRLENEYEVGKKQKENELLKAQNEVKETLIKVAKENEKKTKIFLYSALAVIVIIMVLAFLLYKGLKENREKNKIISEQKHLVEEKNKDITDSINYAKKIQEAILPPKELKYEIFHNAFVMFKPRDIVSGDFYWFTEKNGRRIISAVDCTGHGVPGAFMSMIGNTFLTDIIEGKGITQPANILSELRHLVIKALKQTNDFTENKDGMDMAILSFDDKNNIVEFAGANNPMWMIRDGACIEYKADKRPIGYYRGEGLPFTNHKIQYKKGDTFYIFTDGYADQFGGPKGKKLKYKQLMDILLSIQNEPMLKQEEILDKRFEEWKGSLDQIDDVLVIGVRV